MEEMSKLKRRFGYRKGIEDSRLACGVGFYIDPCPLFEYLEVEYDCSSSTI